MFCAGGSRSEKRSYFTAPNVNPCTSCFCVSQPSTMIGATASREAAESFAQKRPSGLEKEAINAVNGAAFALVRLMLQKASFHAKIIRISAVEESPGKHIGRKRYQSSSQRVAPSIRPASRIAAGTSQK